MRIDSHQHFWRYSVSEYAWINDQMAILRRDHLPAEFKALLKEVGFQGSIAVQARQTVEETEWLLRLAEENRFIVGVVGWVDMRSTQLRETLARLCQSPTLVGIRHVVHDEPDPLFLLRPEFLAGISLLREFGLTYDLLLFPQHLPAATVLADLFPEQRFVLDHIAKPGIGRGDTEPWTSDVRSLARRPNVYCKASGLVTEARWTDWRPDDFRIYLDVILEAFGPTRVMIGSDWPVCTVSAGYAATMGLVMDYLGSLPSAVRERVLGGNCARFYGIAENEG